MKALVGWQTEQKAAPLSKVQLCEYRTVTKRCKLLEASRLYAKFDCPVVRQNFPLLTKLRMISNPAYSCSRELHSNVTWILKCAIESQRRVSLVNADDT